MNQIEQGKLLDLVQVECDLYQQLLERQRNKVEDFLAFDASTWEESLGKESKLLADIRQCQRKIEELAGETSLGQLAASWDGPLSSRLCNQLERLRQVAVTLDQVNRWNFRFLQSSASFNQAFLQQVFKESNQYNDSGRLQLESASTQRKGRRY